MDGNTNHGFIVDNNAHTAVCGENAPV